MDTNENENENENENKVVTNTENTIEDITNDVSDNKNDLTIEHLRAMESRLEARIAAVTKDRNISDNERDALLGKIEHLTETVKHLTEMREQDDDKNKHESTIIVPPSSLDPPINQTPTNTETGENESNGNNGKRRGWKRFY
jgi:predicted  nucleic acid-binding Zn-ribbon protein